MSFLQELQSLYDSKRPGQKSNPSEDSLDEVPQEPATAELPLTKYSPYEDADQLISDIRVEYYDRVGPMLREIESPVLISYSVPTILEAQEKAASLAAPETRQKTILAAYLEFRLKLLEFNRTYNGEDEPSYKDF
ncbi:MAG: hypothetical protein HPY50_16840 [Firmicutes bacterium]|nr:hypothetical protein [Bacillota bacterium]